LFPLEVRIVTSKVAVGGGLLVNRTAEVEVLNDGTGAEVKVLLNNGQQLGVGLDTSAVGVDIHRQGLGNTNGVGDLHQAATGELSSDEGLGNPAGSIGGRAIDLGGVLAREGTSSVGSPTTITAGKAEETLPNRTTRCSTGTERTCQ